MRHRIFFFSADADWDILLVTLLQLNNFYRKKVHNLKIQPDTVALLIKNSKSLWHDFTDFTEINKRSEEFLKNGFLAHSCHFKNNSSYSRIITFQLSFW